MDGEIVAEMVATGAVAAMLLLAEHYWIPARWLGQPGRYVLGVLTLVSPLSVVLVAWQDWHALMVVWAVAGMGGAAVLASYAVDHWHMTAARVAAAEAEGRVLRDEVQHGTD